MKKNLFLKILAMTLAFMLVIGCTGIAALAEEVAPDADGDITINNESGTFEYTGDVEGIVRVSDFGDYTTELTINGDVTSEATESAIVSTDATDGANVTIEVGDVTVTEPTESEEYTGPGVGVNIEGEKSEVEMTTGDVTVEQGNGVEVYAAGGTANVTTEDVEATETGVSVSETKLVEVEGMPISNDEFQALNATYVEDLQGRSIYKTEAGDTYFSTYDDETGEVVWLKCKVTAPAGTATVTVDGDITVDGNSYDTYGVSVSNENNEASAEVDVNGDVTVSSEDQGYTYGALARSEDGNATVNVAGKISVSGEGEYNWTYGVDASADGEDANTTVVVSNGIEVDAGTDEGAYGFGIVAGAYNEGTTEVDVTGDINVSGAYANGIEASASQKSEVGVTVDGDLNVKAEEDGKAIYVDNIGGKIDVAVNGDVTSTAEGIVVFDRMGAEKSLPEDQYPEFNEDEFLRTEYGGNGSTDIYCHVEGDKKIYYYAAGGTVYYAFTDESVVPGTTRVEVAGDLTAAKDAVYVDVANEKSKVDIIVDGTVSGKTQSVLVAQDSLTDNLTLTVWEIKENKDGNLVETENEDGTTTANAELEKKIQYIIRIEPTQANIISTQGTTQYEGYNVAHEGDTVTLKLNVPAGYRVANAFNGTDVKVELVKDASGNYYIVVPRGGAVMLSIELEKIPAKNIPTKDADASAAADMAAAADTAETTALKAQISGDVLSVLPDDIKAKVEGATKVAEAITMTLENYDAGMGAVTVKVKAGKTFAKGEKAKVVIALPDGNGGFTFFFVEGEGQEDGTLALNLSGAIAKALAGKIFVTMILE